VPQGVENVEEFTIAAWLKREGEPVATGEPLLEALTDKASFQIDSEQDGVLRRIFAPAKSTVPVGYVVGIVARADETLPDVQAQNDRILRERAERLASTGPGPGASAGPEPLRGARGLAGRAAGAVGATPAARRRAREAGVTLDEVARRLGKRGVLSQKDVEAYLQGKQP
jgi:pyruvate/2-oxoglutarate dehydrogenase complex dihydrolipoamide acyltransferase (E2) component